MHPCSVQQYCYSAFKFSGKLKFKAIKLSLIYLFNQKAIKASLGLNQNRISTRQILKVY